MNFFGFTISRKAQTLTLDQLIQRLEAAYVTSSGVQVTPENCGESPTIQAIDRAIGGTIATLPIHVYKKSLTDFGERKELLTNHPVARLLAWPNDHQDRVTFWLDATSWLLRYGNFYAVKMRGKTGPIRALEPVMPNAMKVEQADDLSVTYTASRSQGDQITYTRDDVLHARGPAANGYVGDSPIVKAREAIALEIAAEKFGGTFFGNGAMPSLIFQYMQGFQGFKTDEDRNKFRDDFQNAYGKQGRFKALLLPKGLELKDPITLDNDKAQFLGTRKLQRTILAGIFGVPPHEVGDLEKGTFNNVEQQKLEFLQKVVLFYVRIFEAAMERDLLTKSDRAQGVIIRFNVDAALRGDFKTRQEGLRIQREAGVINPNEWREREGMNPRTDAGGSAYWDQGPSGQGAKPAAAPAGEEIAVEEEQPTT